MTEREELKPCKCGGKGVMVHMTGRGFKAYCEEGCVSLTGWNPTHNLTAWAWNRRAE